MTSRPSEMPPPAPPPGSGPGPEEDAVERAFGLGILSLDIVTPAFEGMGLAPIDAGSLVAALREGHDRGAVRAAGGMTAAAIVGETTDCIQKRLGARAAADFERWLEGLWLAASRDRQANIWRSIVTYGRIDGSRDMREVPAVVRRLREEVGRWPALPDLRRWPVSAWDVSMFEELGYEGNPALADPDERSPLAWVKNRAAFAAFCNAWEVVLGRSADRERDLEDLWRFRRHEAVLLDLPIEEIARPGDWRLPRFGA